MEGDRPAPLVPRPLVHSPWLQTIIKLQPRSILLLYMLNHWNHSQNINSNDIDFSVYIYPMNKIPLSIFLSIWIFPPWNFFKRSVYVICWVIGSTGLVFKIQFSNFFCVDKLWNRNHWTIDKGFMFVGYTSTMYLANDLVPNLQCLRNSFYLLQ